MSGSKNNGTFTQNGILCSRKKEGAITLCDSKDGTGEHYAKWNKPGGERQILSDISEIYFLSFYFSVIERKSSDWF